MLLATIGANPILSETTDQENEGHGSSRAARGRGYEGFRGCVRTDLAKSSPAGTAENDPGRQSWVNWTTRERYGNHPRSTRSLLGLAAQSR